MIIKLSEIINNQPVINLGCIGHVSHGKSTLVRSLTGIKTQINDFGTVNTSSPNFLKVIKQIGGKFEIKKNR